MDAPGFRAYREGMWTRRTFPLIFWGLWAAAIIGGSGALVLIAALLTAGYGVSLVIHPRARCLRCDGTGEVRGSIYGWTHRRCPHCQGGRIIRLGARVFGLGHVRGQARQNRAHAAATRRHERW